MILAFHSIFSAYGFWPPNDPRGSWSDFVASWELFRYGPATKTDSRRSVAAAPHDKQQREEAKTKLRFTPVVWDGLQARAIGTGFAAAAAEGEYRIHACAILPDHVHLIIGRHARAIRRIVGHLKARGTQRLKDENHWPNAKAPVWASRGWNVFIDDLDHLNRAIAYVENNPLKEGLSAQRWKFVVPYVPI